MCVCERVCTYDRCVNGFAHIIGVCVNGCQLVWFIHKPYGFLRFARAYGRTMQFLWIFMIFADSTLYIRTVVSLQ